MDNKSDIIEIPLKIESRNVLDKQHWAVKRRSKKEWAVFIRNQIRLKKIKKAKCEKYSISIISYRKKQLDYDNLVGGCKQLIDALTDEGFIFDDSPDYIDLHVEQHVTNFYKTIIIRK